MRVKRAFETLKGYCEKHSNCRTGCVFYDSQKGCIFQNGAVLSDLEIPKKEELSK